MQEIHNPPYTQDVTYITTSIPYVNGHPHIGHALELVQADAIARYSRLLGRKTNFQTGTDDNAFKNVLSARAEGIPTRELVNRNSGVFRSLAKELRVSYDHFIQTSGDRHGEGVHQFWRRLNPGDIYLKSYEGLYCTGCEDFYLEKDLVNGRCPDHGTEPVQVRESNYFFRLSSYQDRLEKRLRSGEIAIVPSTRTKEILSFIRTGLQDISISRPSDRSGGWGIRVPSDSTQVIYVWIDALINYVSGLGYGVNADWSEFWSEEAHKIHVIGKNVWKFHAVYWPALLLSAGLPLPDEILVHGFITEDGRKISKSLKNAADPFDYVERYGTDAIRYYLLRNLSPFEDGDLAAERLVLSYNSDLANGLGNLVSRLTTLCSKGRYGRYEYEIVPEAPPAFHEAVAGRELDKAVRILWSILSQVNQDIDREEPWRKLAGEDIGDLRVHLTRWLREVHRIAYWLSPFLPDASQKILDLLSTDPVAPGKPLFPRIE